MKIKFVAGCEFQDASVAGGLRRFSAGDEADIHDNVAVGCIRNGFAVLSGTEETEPEKTDDDKKTGGGNDDSAKAIESARANLTAAQAEFDSATGRARGPAGAKLARAKKALVALESKTNE